MSYYEEDDQKTWVEMPPELPQRGNNRNKVLIAGIVAGVLLALCICSGGVYLAIQQFKDRAVATPSVIQVPTPLGGATATSVLGEPTASSQTPVVVAPTVTVGSSTRPEPPLGAGNVDVPRLAGVPVLDGNLTEWADVPRVESRFQVYRRDDWDGSDDLQATWQLGWDNNNLYVAVTVIDDIHVQNQVGETTYRGDSLEMQIDTDRAGDYREGLSPDDIQLVLSPGDFAGLRSSTVRFRGTNAGTIPQAPGHNIQTASQKTVNGYTLEAIIPWRDLNITPRPDMVLGLCLNANDNDRVGEAVQEVMKSHVSTRTFSNPTTWGSMTLK